MQQVVSQSLIHLCRAHRKLAESRLNNIGLYAGQEAILLTLIKLDGMSLSELSDMMGVEAPTMTKTINRLEKIALVTRRPDPEDGRVWRIFITESGRELEEQIRVIWEDIETKLTRGLSEAEAILLQRLLSHLHNNLQTG